MKAIACDGDGAMRSNELLAVPLVVLGERLPLAAAFLAESEEGIEQPRLTTLDHRCRCCGNTWRVPGVARRETLEELEAVLQILRDYAVETGAMAWSVAGLKAMCYAAIAAKADTGHPQ